MTKGWAQPPTVVNLDSYHTSLFLPLNHTTHHSELQWEHQQKRIKKNEISTTVLRKNWQQWECDGFSFGTPQTQWARKTVQDVNEGEMEMWKSSSKALNSSVKDSNWGRRGFLGEDSSCSCLTLSRDGLSCSPPRHQEEDPSPFHCLKGQLLELITISRSWKKRGVSQYW